MSALAVRRGGADRRATELPGLRDQQTGNPAPPRERNSQQPKYARAVHRRLVRSGGEVDDRR